ncbi:Fe-S cluster assembly protein SufD [Companilactobacillus nantensis]|uniref:Putative ABC transporter component (Putative) n=1 Tax=Companilactobacillus nantensis DSM 16982 TaxID=1423774 RepID=A0A0R1WIH1_9LACO|nr:Fe-S cluster assembly protein SufD [Companilactobacillus nantensis]KRM14739.1 putative ABC transporter component (putative) [Companilactobacillus nantensis DSM 16982]GEO65068.1 Fe-S cluster assembly protein SufD [Companilactobacillus nantensis]
MTPDKLVQIATENNEPAWFVEKRRMALDVMDELPRPTIQRFDFHNWQMTPDVSNRITTTVTPNKDYELMDIFDAINEYPELLQKYYMQKVIKPDENKFTAYHTAFLNQGIVLRVPKNTVIEKPIEINLVQDSVTPFVSHVLIIAEENSQFSFIQKMTTTGNQAAVANCIVEIVAKDNSNIRYAAVDELGENVTSYLSRRAYVGQNAYVDWSIGLMNTGNTVADFDTDLYGEGAHAEIKVVDITSGRQQQGVNTRVTNYGKHSIGHINQRGVIMDRSHLIFNGIGHIIHGASGANAEQQNRVLMMSSKAHGDANPILLIDENDVIAGHAASVGQVDQKQLYYLMSRGIDKKTAERMVIRGFLGDVLVSIPSKIIREQLVQTIERKLENGQQVSENS